MARLSRAAFRAVWANPLKSPAGYATLAQGVSTALPYLDELEAGDCVESLEALAAVVAA